jgi:hypothetical protein
MRMEARGLRALGVTMLLMRARHGQEMLGNGVKMEAPGLRALAMMTLLERAGLGLRALTVTTLLMMPRAG